MRILGDTGAVSGEQMVLVKRLGSGLLSVSSFPSYILSSPLPHHTLKFLKVTSMASPEVALTSHLQTFFFQVPEVVKGMVPEDSTTPLSPEVCPPQVPGLVPSQLYRHCILATSPAERV